MDDLWFCDKLQKVIRDREYQISEILLNNELSDMAQYRNLMGEISALGLIDQEIKEFLKKGNESDRHIIRPRAFDQDA